MTAHIVPTSEAVSSFIYKIWGDDPIMYSAVRFGMDIKSITREVNAILVEFVCMQDPSDHDDTLCKLFDYDPDYRSGFFPSGINRATMTMRFSWKSAASCTKLSRSSYTDECLNIDTQLLKWDSPDITDGLIESIMESADGEAIATTLWNYHDAHSGMPEMVPARLLSYFQKYLDKYPTEENGQEDA